MIPDLKSEISGMLGRVSSGRLIQIMNHVCQTCVAQSPPQYGEEI